MNSQRLTNKLSKITLFTMSHCPCNHKLQTSMFMEYKRHISSKTFEAELGEMYPSYYYKLEYQ